MTCVGVDAPFTYKRSRMGDSVGDRVAELLLRELDHVIEPFVPFGSDERQFCSPGFNLPVGSLMTAMYGRFAEYHTSLDDKAAISFRVMGNVVDLYARVIKAIGDDITWKSNVPYGEPFLRKRRMFPAGATLTQMPPEHCALMWLLNLADGCHRLIDIAERSGLSYELLAEVADDAHRAGLISRAD